MFASEQSGPSASLQQCKQEGNVKLTLFLSSAFLISGLGENRTVSEKDQRFPPAHMSMTSYFL